MLRHLKKHEGNSSVSVLRSKSTKEPSSGGMATRNVTKALNKDKDDLISHLLGIQDDQIVEQLLNNPDAQGAAQLLGLGAASSAKSNSTPAT